MTRGGGRTAGRGGQGYFWRLIRAGASATLNAAGILHGGSLAGQGIVHAVVGEVGASDEANAVMAVIHLSHGTSHTRRCNQVQNEG